MDSPIVELKDISLRSDRGGFVFQGLNLVVEPGQSALIAGSSGSGKSLLADIILGRRHPSEGVVSVFGENLSRRRRICRARRKIGGVGGVFDLIPSMTVVENITMPLVMTAERKKIQKERLLRSLTEFSLLKVADKYPHQLTRVEQTLVQFARATIGNQPLIIIDEPSAGLDPATSERVFEFLVKVALSGRSMIILASDLPTSSIPNSIRYTLSGGILA